jgi:hypothetical protein
VLTVPSRSTAGPRRTSRRPAVVGAAAALLGLYGAFSVLGGLQDGLDPLPALGGVVLLLTAAGLLWGGRVGYWLGLTVTAILTTLVVQVLVRHRETALGVAAGVMTAPLLLLAVPAARRPPPPPEPVAAAAAPTLDADAARSPAWIKERSGWGGAVAAVLLGLFLLAGGVAMTWSGQGSQRGLGVSLALFGLACIVMCPTVAPKRRHGQPTLETLRIGGRQESGVAFPYSRTTVAVSLAGLFLMGLAMLGVAVAAAPPLLIRLVGIVGGVALLLLVVLVALRRGAGRRLRVVLTPSAVVYAPGEVAVMVPWAAITDVTRFAATYFTRGAVARQRFVQLVVNNRNAVHRSGLARGLLAERGDTVSLPVNALDVTPALLYQALRYYHRHPAARQELASGPGLERVRRGDFDQPAAPEYDPVPQNRDALDD